MKKNEIIKLIVFPILLISSILGLNFGLFARMNDDLTSYGQFYKEEENCLDVVLIGNSTLREGYVPTHVWHQYNITSRSLSSSPTHPEVIKVAINNVMNFQHPKCVFIDLNGLTFQKRSDSEFFIKQYFKALPKGNYKDELEDMYPYLKDDDDNFELFNNHNNFRQQQYWESLVYPEQFITKGYYPNRIIHHVKPIQIDENKTLELSNDGNYYFHEILNECLKYSDQTTFIFGKMPRFNTSKEDNNSTYQFRTIEKLLENTNIKFLDFCNRIDEIGLSKDSDFKDNEHLNHLGAIKFSEYFAKCVKEEFNIDIKDKEEKTIKNFDEAYLKTKDYLDGIKNDLLKKVK